MGGRQAHAWARERKDLGKDSGGGGLKKTESSVESQESASALANKKKAPPNTKVDGLLQLLRADTGALIVEFTECHEWLRDLKFAPDGRTLVAAGSDGNCHVFAQDASGEFTKRHTLQLARGACVTALDVSTCGRFVCCGDEARVLSHGDLRAGAAVPDAMQLRETAWASWTVPLGWACLAPHAAQASPRAGGYEVVSDSSEETGPPQLALTACARSRGSETLATGDAHGVLRLHRFPAADCAQQHARLVAHVGAVRRLCWTHGDAHLVHAGRRIVTSRPLRCVRVGCRLVSGLLSRGLSMERVVESRRRRPIARIRLVNHRYRPLYIGYDLETYRS